MDVSDYAPLGAQGAYVKPAERKAILEQIRNEPPREAPQSPEEPRRIGGRTRQEFVVEFVLTLQANPSRNILRVTATVADALAFWECMVCDVGYDE